MHNPGDLTNAWKEICERAFNILPYNYLLYVKISLCKKTLKENTCNTVRDKVQYVFVVKIYYGDVLTIYIFHTIICKHEAQLLVDPNTRLWTPCYDFINEPKQFILTFGLPMGSETKTYSGTQKSSETSTFSYWLTDLEAASFSDWLTQKLQTFNMNGLRNCNFAN